MEAVCDPAANEGLNLMVAGLDRVAEAGVSPVSSADAVAWVRSIETIGRRVESLRIELLAAIDADNLHVADGHFSAKKMVEHHGALSPGEGTTRERTRRMFAELRDLAAAFAAGEVGVDQVRWLGRTYSNKRVRSFMADAQGWFLDQAESLSFQDFRQVVTEWERLIDIDGARDRNQRNHENRNVTLVQDAVDLGWKLDGSWASLTGSELEKVLRGYVKVEYQADWDKARAEHGEAANLGHLPRTAAQRRADAMAQIFHDAANSGTTLSSPPVHNIVWSCDSYEQMLVSLETGVTPTLTIGTHRCSTIDGVPVDPTEAVLSSLVAQVRRVVVNTAGVVIDMGRARLFTGSARHAALLNSPRCVWPGCHVPATDCQIDHLVEHAHRGRTNPGNGAPLCGKHNRHKHNAGFAIQRNPDGTFTITRPDGSILQ